MSYQLRVAGAGTRTTKPDFSGLCDQAVDLAGRGYTVVLVETTATHRGLEVRKRDGVLEVEPFNNHSGTSAHQPGWLATAQHRIEANILRRTAL